MTDDVRNTTSCAVRCSGCGQPLRGRSCRVIVGLGQFHEECAPPRWPILAPKPQVSTANG